MSRVKLTANNECHSPVKGGQAVEDLIEIAAKGNLRDYLATGGDINVKASAGIGALHALARKGSGSSTDKAAFAALMAAGIDVDPLNHRLETPLFRAVVTRSVWLWGPLVAAGADLGVINRKGVGIADLLSGKDVEAWANTLALHIENKTPQTNVHRSSPRL